MEGRGCMRGKGVYVFATLGGDPQNRGGRAPLDFDEPAPTSSWVPGQQRDGEGAGHFGLKNGQTAGRPGGCFVCRVFISRHVGIVAFASKARSKPPCPRVIGLCELWPLAWKFAWRELKTLQRRVAQLFDGSILHFPPLHAGGEEPLTDVRSQPRYFRRQPCYFLH